MTAEPEHFATTARLILAALNPKGPAAMTDPTPEALDQIWDALTEEPHHAAARQPTDEERAALEAIEAAGRRREVLAVLRERNRAAIERAAVRREAGGAA